ncbi:MAG: carbonic anhydrase [Desulfocapsaceae bacterium]|jgi:carbonic anhydrase|nr:carbonic anhydrase [Desulfocapsaceae bacterium]
MGQTTRQRPSAEEALQTLLEGNRRFVSGNLLHPNHCEESRQGVASGQDPIAVVLTCADSRVPPVDIFDQGIGDIFVVRVAGNIIGDHTLGSIEYAALHLHTPLIIVLGHSCCGAIGAVASDVKLDGHMSTFVPPIQAAIKIVKNDEGDLVNNTARELARQMAQKIADSEPIIADLVQHGKTRVVPAYYDLHSGEVSILTSTTDKRI